VAMAGCGGCADGATLLLACVAGAQLLQINKSGHSCRKPPEGTQCCAEMVVNMLRAQLQVV
jgi:hypothetical protein